LLNLFFIKIQYLIAIYIIASIFEDKITVKL